MINNEITIDVEADKLLNITEKLKYNEKIKCSCLIGIFGAHYPNDEKEFLIQYLLLSIENNIRYRVSVKISQDDDIQSIETIFSGSVWYEREIFDMFGVKFSNLSDHRRILTDYDFKHHPLRKDFPVTGFEEVKYDPVSCEVEYFPLNLAQEYRSFDNKMDIDQNE